MIKNLFTPKQTTNKSISKIEAIRQMRIELNSKYEYRWNDLIRYKDETISLTYHVMKFGGEDQLIDLMLDYQLRDRAQSPYDEKNGMLIVQQAKSAQQQCERVLATVK